jgi:mRNA interferase HigB
VQVEAFDRVKSWLDGVRKLRTLHFMAMRVISKAALRDFWQKHPEAEGPLRNWHTVAKNATWDNPHDVRATFNSVDLYGRCHIFNVAGNRYRIIAAIHFNTHRVFVRHVLTHAEYDQDQWKPECEI